MPNSSSVSPDPFAQFTRTIDFFGEDGFERLHNAFVAVVGLGGVGSHAACGLARAGVGHLRLIDFDEVSVSSLNRHAVATLRDVGKQKALVVAEYLTQVHSNLKVEPTQAFFHHDTADALLSGPPDFVIDAIDSENPKLALLQYCMENKIRVVSCMGAAARSDPTRIRIADISKTDTCPLARNIRHRLKRAGITEGFEAVFSLEKPRPSLPPDENEPRLHKGRARRRLPSLPTIPAISGLTAVSVVLSHLTGSADLLSRLTS